MEDTNLALYQRAISCDICEIAEELIVLAQSVATTPKVIHRVKDPNTLAQKIILQSAKSVLDITDVYGLRILVSDVAEIYEVLCKLNRTFSGYIDHDYIETPKTRLDKPHLIGKSFRTLQFVAYKNEVPFQVQITTFGFNRMNEVLHAEYHLDKYGSLSQS